MNELAQQVESLISRIEKCVSGDKFEAQLTELPIKVAVHVFWEQYRNATVLYEVDFEPSRMSEAEERLLDFIVSSYELGTCPILDDTFIRELPSFSETADKIDKFHNEVNTVLAELEDLVKSHPETCAPLGPLLGRLKQED